MRGVQPLVEPCQGGDGGHVLSEALQTLLLPFLTGPEHMVFEQSLVANWNTVWLYPAHRIR